MTDFRVNVIVDPTGAKSGAKQTEKALEGIGQKAAGLQNSLSKLFAGLATFGTIKSILGLATEYQNLQNRLRAVSDEGTNLAQTQAALEDIARRTRAPLAETTELYARLITSSKELGKTQGQILQFTESLNKAIALSGASSAEAAAGIVQLSQGLSSGALRGDELRSVLEQLPAVADVIARGMGVTRGELRKLGGEGKLTAEAIFQAFAKLGPELDQKFGKTLPTLTQAMVLFNNEVLAFIGAGDQASGVTAVLAEGFQRMARSIKEARDFYSGFREVAEVPETEAALSSVGVQIARITKEIRDLESRPVINDATIARIRDLEKQLESFQQQAAKVTGLGAIADPGKAAEAAKKQAESLDAQKKALEAIRGPQQEYQVKLEAIQALLAQGKISQTEYNIALEGLGKGLEKVAGANAAQAFKEQETSLRNQIDLITTKIRQGEAAAQVLAFEQELVKQHITLTEEQKTQLQKLYDAQIKLEKVESDRAAFKEKGKANQEAEQAALAALILELDVKKQLALEEERLNRVLETRPDLVAQVTERQEDLRLRALESSNALGDGFERAFIKIKREAEDLAAVGEKVVNVFADQATDALIEFAKTGEFSFKEFATSVLDDLTKILARLLIIQALNAAIGGAGSLLGSGAEAGLNVAGARAEGGPVSANRSYLVGENGPELFTPKQAGMISPSSTAAPAAPPEVKLQVVNVQDQRMVPEAISGGLADQAIINVLSRNKEAVKSTLA